MSDLEIELNEGEEDFSTSLSMPEDMMMKILNEGEQVYKSMFETVE